MQYLRNDESTAIIAAAVASAVVALMEAMKVYAYCRRLYRPVSIAAMPSIVKNRNDEEYGINVLANFAVIESEGALQ